MRIYRSSFGNTLFEEISLTKYCNLWTPLIEKTYSKLVYKVYHLHLRTYMDNNRIIFDSEQ